MKPDTRQRTRLGFTRISLHWRCNRKWGTRTVLVALPPTPILDSAWREQLTASPAAPASPSPSYSRFQRSALLSPLSPWLRVPVTRSCLVLRAPERAQGLLKVTVALYNRQCGRRGAYCPLRSPVCVALAKTAFILFLVSAWALSQGRRGSNLAPHDDHEVVRCFLN